MKLHLAAVLVQYFIEICFNDQPADDDFIENVVNLFGQALLALVVPRGTCCT